MFTGLQYNPGQKKLLKITCLILPSVEPDLKLELAESIREVLMDRFPVSIYGLGTLMLRQEPARYGDGRKSLLPPTMKLEFSETSSTNARLIDWLAAKYKIKRNLAELAVKKYSEKVLNTLLNTRSVHIPGVAVFERDALNDIHCIADHTMLDAFYKGLPEVKLEIPRPIATGEGQKGISESEQEDADIPLPSSPEDHSPESHEEAALTSETEEEESSAELLQRDAEEKVPGDGRDEDEQEASDAEVFDLDSVMEETGESDALKEIEAILAKAEADSAKDTNRRLSYFWGSFLILFSIALAVILLIDACQHFGWFSSKGQKAEGSLLELHEAPASDALAAEMLARPVQPIAGPDSCIIITGVFASSANVSSMKERLASAGYDIYEEARGRYTRVGLSFDCSDTDLEAFIRNVRKEISPKAWYLDPELYVAYAQ